MLETFMQNVVQIFAFFATFALLMSPLIIALAGGIFIFRKSQYKAWVGRDWKGWQTAVAMILLSLFIILELAFVGAILDTPGNLFYDSWNMGF